MKKRFLIDTDTAADDAVALIMAFRHPEVEIEAITVVAGNVPVDQAVQNALFLTELCGKQIPVYRGAAKPMLRELETAQFVHGKDGLSDIGLDLQGRQGTPGNAIDAIIQAIEAFPHEIELVTLGPLTNIAIALLKEPSIAEKVKCCTLMGGVGSGYGNITPVSEYNIWVDPEAAQIVFRSGMHIKMVGWDMSRNHAFFTDEDIAALRALNTPMAHFVVDIQKAPYAFTSSVSKIPGFELPDPIAMAVALDPEVATVVQSMYAEVICGEGLTRGQTVMDHAGAFADRPGIEVVLEASRERFLKLLYEAVR
ncbi:MAG: nucleoside hydrolase [Bacteroidetes bacterium]|nr:MAG: nucleoside hydrolase [Bacteroidota bacterium]